MLGEAKCIACHRAAIFERGKGWIHLTEQVDGNGFYDKIKVIDEVLAGEHAVMPDWSGVLWEK